MEGHIFAQIRNLHVRLKENLRGGSKDKDTLSQVRMNIRGRGTNVTPFR
jgi:hypothetical protein